MQSLDESATFVANSYVAASGGRQPIDKQARITLSEETMENQNEPLPNLSRSSHLVSGAA